VPAGGVSCAARARAASSAETIAEIWRSFRRRLAESESM
jgi:hypothetical protein